MPGKRFTNTVAQLKPDPRYQSKLVSKFVNYLMEGGKKSTALAVFYDAMDIVVSKMPETPPLEVFETAVANVKPSVEVRSKRVGGQNYQVPMQVNRKRQQSLAIRWIIEAVRTGKGSPTCQRLAAELMAAFRKEGTAIQTRTNVHRMADANKAFAHFAW
jgi:small subunit ribosomal protein S7